MSRQWTKQTAEDTLKGKIASGKVISFDGSFSLRQCSAADYLIGHQGYR